MKGKLLNIVMYTMVVYILASCAAGQNTARYYYDNKSTLDSIRSQFAKQYKAKPFHIVFKDKSFQYISYEILSDTFRYIYNFDLRESKLSDTLSKYGYDVPGIIGLIADMQSIKCTWISQLDYYEDRQKKTLVFISTRHNQLQSLLKGEKYYALAFFNEKQFFDKEGRLTDKSEKKRMREINGQVFHKITDRICYAITGSFR